MFCSLSVDEVADFLKQQKLGEFVDAFRANSIDGDLLEAILARNKDKVMVPSKGTEMLVTDIILEELGMTTAPQRLRVRGKFRRYTDSVVSVHSSVQQTTSASKRT